MLFHSIGEAKEYIKDHAEEIRQISYDEIMDWAAEIRQDKITATEVQEEILDAETVAVTPASEENSQNYHILKGELETGTIREKCWKNILAIETVKQLEKEQRQATKEEQNILAITLDGAGSQMFLMRRNHSGRKKGRGYRRH